MRPRRRRSWARLFGVAVVASSATIAGTVSCGFEHGRLSTTPDAGPCTKLGTTCAARKLLTCNLLGELPSETTCAWGCVDDPTPARCGRLMPAGGAVLPSDLDSSSTLIDVVIDSDTNIYGGGGSAGQITNSVRSSNNSDTTYEEIDGIGYVLRNNVGVFRVKSLTINATVDIRGPNAVAFVALGDITINGVVDAQGSGSDGCGSGSGVRQPGPGGFAGGQSENPGSGAGGGSAGSSASSEETGGGGAGHGGSGGSGAKAPVHTVAPSGGNTYGNELIATLAGGAGGGGGGSGGNGGGDGGGGGGALQLVAGGTVRIIGAAHGINAGGCGGEAGSDSGGGGGAGGTILIEAPLIVIDGAGIAVNGGGGGGTGNSDGQHGQLAPIGSIGGVGSGIGGLGGGADAIDGQSGSYVSRPGGGGGAAGRVRLNTWDGTVTILNGGFVSPALTSTPTSATAGKPRLE